MKYIGGVLLIIVVLSCTAAPVIATEELARQSGQDCGYCHLDPSGGGELSAAGQSYRDSALTTGAIQPLSPASKLFRLLIGYIHLVFAVFWFGTILYVHLILKPAYAARGLPRGEKLLGITSFVVMGISGAILTHYRIDSLAALTDSRFGILLLIKVALYVTMLLSAIVVIRVIGPRLKSGGGQTRQDGEPFTAQSLQRYDGQEGRPAYFAYLGKVYDAGNSRLWPAGLHMKRHAAGADLTSVLALAPHAEDVIFRLPVIGEFAATDHDSQTTTAKTFYVIAYLNLLFVFAILLIIALWRWG